VERALDGPAIEVVAKAKRRGFLVELQKQAAALLGTPPTEIS
jgi:hypothetical protein